MARRKRDKLHAARDKQRLGTDQKCIGPLFNKRRKGRIDVGICTGGDDFDLPPDRRSRRLQFRDKRLGDARIAGIDEHGKARNRSFSPIGMAPMLRVHINLASSVIGVSGATHSTPLCIASLTFMRTSL